MNALDDLVRICPPPGRPPSAVDWTTTEDTLGTALPADYKRLVETYGEGVFDDTIWLLSPGSPHPGCDQLAQTAERDEILGGLWEAGEEQPSQFLEPGSRILPWAYEEGTGAFLYWWVRPGQHPDEWTVLYNEGRGPLWEHHDSTCAALVLAVLTGTARTDYFAYLYNVLKPVEHRFQPAGEIFGATETAV